MIAICNFFYIVNYNVCGLVYASKNLNTEVFEYVCMCSTFTQDALN